MTNTYTFKDAIDAVYSRTKEIDSAYLPSTNVKQWLNDGHKEAVNEKYYPFMDATYNFNTSGDTTLAEKIKPTDTDFDVADASVLPSSAIIQIKDDIIEYTNSSGNNLTGVTGIGSNHSSGDKVKRVYDIVDEFGINNFSKPIYLEIDGVEFEYYDGRGKLDGNKYTIIDGFLFLPDSSEIKSAIFKYETMAVKLTDDDDTFMIPDDYIKLVIDYALSNAYLDLDNVKADIHYNKYLRGKKSFSKDYSKQTEATGRRIKSIYQ